MGVNVQWNLKLLQECISVHAVKYNYHRPYLASEKGHMTLFRLFHLLF